MSELKGVSPTFTGNPPHSVAMGPFTVFSSGEQTWREEQTMQLFAGAHGHGGSGCSMYGARVAGHIPFSAWEEEGHVNLERGYRASCGRNCRGLRRVPLRLLYFCSLWLSWCLIYTQQIEPL